jgi:hypothetical protein
VFGALKFVPVAIFLDRTNSQYRVEHEIDFSEWEGFLKRLRKASGERKN